MQAKVDALLAEAKGLLAKPLHAETAEQALRDLDEIQRLIDRLGNAIVVLSAKAMIDGREIESNVVSKQEQVKWKPYSA